MSQVLHHYYIKLRLVGEMKLWVAPQSTMTIISRSSNVPLTFNVPGTISPPPSPVIALLPDKLLPFAPQPSSLPSLSLPSRLPPRRDVVLCYYSAAPC